MELESISPGEMPQREWKALFFFLVSLGSMFHLAVLALVLLGYYYIMFPSIFITFFPAHGSQAFRLLLRHFFLLASHDDNNAGPPLLELSCLVDSFARRSASNRARTALFREPHLADDLWAFLEPKAPWLRAGGAQAL